VWGWLGTYFLVLVLIYLMPKPSVAESLTWAFAIGIPEGEAVQGRIGTVGYDRVQVHVYLIPIPLLENL
jgi:hypothetical protein